MNREDMTAELERLVERGDERPMTLYCHRAGPRIQYGGKMLYIEDLNPEMKTKWAMSRKEMFILGWRFMIASLHW